MKPILFATGNSEKIAMAKNICDREKILIEPIKLEIDEIQGEDPEMIVRDKVIKAYEITKRPTIVSDDSWCIPALNGFPGAYMKSINEWFEPEDFLRLMHGIEDRRVVCQQYLAYMDGDLIKIFKNEIPGKFILEARGVNKKSPNMSVIVLDADNGKTIAEVFEQGEDVVAERYRNTRDVWHEFIEWYKS